jgi:ribosome-associated protein
LTRSRTEERGVAAEAEALALTAAQAIEEKKGEDTVVLAVGEVLAITDWFVITSGANRRLVRTLAEEIEEQVYLLHDRKPRRVEGMAEAQWVLLDYGDVVVHVFSDEMRRFYEIERLYRDVSRMERRANHEAAASDP